MLFFINAISAGDVNATDSSAIGLAYDTSDTLESTVYSNDNLSKSSLSDCDLLAAQNSDTLSTLTYSDDSDKSFVGQSVSSGDVYGATISPTVNIVDTIKSNNVTKYYKGSEKYTAIFTDNYGNALANTKVNINVNGVTKTVTTNSYGVAFLAVDLKPGNYNVIATNPSTNYQLKTTFNILSTIRANDVSKVYTDSKKFTATFLKSNGKALANKNVKFKIDGKTYTVKTNNNGVAGLSMTNLKKGNYKIISYNADGLTKTNNVKVVSSTTSKLKTSDYTFLKSENKKIKVTLLNGLGYAPSSGKIIKFTINGKTYTSKTNSKGFAYLTLPSLANGVYSIRYQFDGNSFYKASKASNKITIIPSKTPQFTVRSGTTFGYGAGNSFSLALSSGSVPLAGKTIMLKINNMDFTRTTDKNGIVYLGMDFPVGKYTLFYTFNGDSKVDAKTESCIITIKQRAKTSITWGSDISSYYGPQTFKVLLKDSQNNPLSGKTVKLTVDSKDYTATTSSTGYVVFNIDMGVGKYNVICQYEAARDNDNAPSSISQSVSINQKPITNGYGYWVFGGDMKNVDLGSIASQGTTDLFLNYYAITKHGKSAVETWIASANSLGMRVHIWMQAFYDGDWINPVKNGSPNTAYFNKLINKAKTYAAIKGVAGIHFDYLRYSNAAYKTSGGTAAISKFAKLASQTLHNAYPSLIVSCSMMAETTNDIHYYGQDISALSMYMDLIIPLAYKGENGQNTAWITSVTKWFVQNSKGAKIWMGLQGYKSDKSVTKLSSSESTGDVKAAIDAGANGAMLFRWGLTNTVIFKSIADGSTGASVSVADILTAASSLKNTIDANGNIPSKVSINGVKYSAYQFLYMMAKATVLIKSGKSNSQVMPVTAALPASSTGDASGQLYKSGYVDVASRVASYIISNKQVPNFATSDLGKISYEQLIDSFSRILAYYNTYKEMPNYVTVKKVSMTTGTAGKTISIKDILTGATNLKKYYSNNNMLPNTVTAGGITFTTPEFLYLMSKAIYQIGNSDKSNIAYIIGVDAPESPYGDTISSEQLTKSNYLTVAKNVANYISSNNLAPNFASSKLGKIIYSELVDSFSRILAYYKSNGELPSYVTVTYGSSSSSIISMYEMESGLNQKNTGGSISIYLKSTTNCPVGNSAISSLVRSLTSGLTSDLAKAKAIFNYVRDYISYGYYYNTKYGAVGTLNARIGNCVDQSHLVIAMFRTAGLPARYVHGTCSFNDGTFGHVWAQVLVNGNWYVADCISYKNSLGSVNNWNTKTFTLHGIYSSISF